MGVGAHDAGKRRGVQCALGPGSDRPRPSVSKSLWGGWGFAWMVATSISRQKKAMVDSIVRCYSGWGIASWNSRRFFSFCKLALLSGVRTLPLGIKHCNDSWHAKGRSLAICSSAMLERQMTLWLDLWTNCLVELSIGPTKRD